MPDVVEIYLCKAGQKLEEGRLVVSNDIDSREAAESDALSRCASDSSLARLAYYAVNDNGDFKVFFSYTNPDVASAAPAETNTPAQKKPSSKKKTAAKKTLWRKFTDFYKE